MITNKTDMKIELEKGNETVVVTIPEDRVARVITGKDIPGLDQAVIHETIDEGIKEHTPPEISKKKIAIIIPDDTRLWARGDLFVPVIVESLFNLGVSPGNIRIIIALGTHNDIDEEKFAELAGSFSVDQVEILNSANKNSSRLICLGETKRKTEVHITKEAVEADHIIIYGGVLHHMAAGYGGGRKYIFPGIAGYDSIQQNHSLAMLEDGSAHPLVRQAQLHGNPINEDITEAVQLFLKNKTCTYVAIAANGHGEIFHTEVGPLQETFRNSCQQLDDICRVAVPQKEDFALISAGGHRADGQLYQATKALFNCVNIVKEGGQILFVAGCAEGAGNETFASALKNYRHDRKSLGKKLVTTFSMPSYVAFRVLDILDRFEVSLVTDLTPSQTQEFGFNYVEVLENYVNNLQGRGYVIPYAENIFPVADVV